MTALYVISGILFLIPSSLLGAAWRRAVQNKQVAVRPNWRMYSFQVALFLATITTLSSMFFFVSFFYNGGDPHGMGPSPGLWKMLGPASTYLIATTFLFTILGKGKGKLMLLIWAVAIVLVGIMIIQMDMD